MICPKCCWKLEVVAQRSSVKMKFFFVKLYDRPATILKRTLSLAFSCESIYVNVFFIFTFFSEKTKAASRDVLWKKCSDRFWQFTGKHLGWSLFLKRLQVFRYTYFEEQLLTTASKNINICLTIKVLLLLRIKLLNSNVNKKKACAKTWRQKSCDTRIVGDRRLF